MENWVSYMGSREIDEEETTITEKLIQSSPRQRTSTHCAITRKVFG